MTNPTLQALLAQANQEAEESGTDLNVAVKGGGGGRLLPVGYAFGQFVEYVELGMQPQEFGGKQKDPAMEFSIAFALTGTGYSNDDGTPYVVRPYSMALSQNEKARAFKLFKKLNYKGTAKNFGQLLGEKFLVHVEQVPKSKTDPKLVSRINLEGFLPPFDMVSKQPYPIADAPAELYKLFLWNRPTKVGWDALFIEGKFDDGNSKNRIQETMLAALDFQGSPLQMLLGGAQTAQVALPAVPATPAAPVAAAVPTVAVAAPPGPVVAPAVTQAVTVAVPVSTAGSPAVPQVAAPLVPALPAAPAAAIPTVPSAASAPVLPVLPA